MAIRYLSFAAPLPPQFEYATKTRLFLRHLCMYKCDIDTKTGSGQTHRETTQNSNAVFSR
jgi:hypothetical protein